MEKEHLKIFLKIPTLETERLVLRRMLLTDISDINEYASDPEVSRYLLWYPHASIDFTKRYLKLVDKKYKSNDFFDWAVTYNGKMIGTCGFSSLDVHNNCGEIGYVLNRAFWGRELAVEAVGAVITFGFEVLGLNRIEARFMIENSASRRVLEKCGLKSEGVLREAIIAKGSYKDIEIFSMTATDYKKFTSKV